MILLRWTVGLGFALHLTWAVLACGLPLARGLGFERALVSGVLASLVGTAIGLAEARRAPSPGGLGRALLLATLLTLPSAAAGAFMEWRGPTCVPEQGAQFFLLLAVSDAVIGAALGFAAGRSVRSYLGAAGVVAAVHAIFAAWALRELYVEPQVSFHLLPLGYWPGPLYDEALVPSPGLWVYRAAAVGLLVAPALIAAAPRRWNAYLASATSLGLGSWAYLAGGNLGFDLHRSDVEAALARVVRTEHFELHLDPRFDEDEVADIVLEHEFAWRRLEQVFETAPSSSVRSYVYHSADQKGRLIGAARTQVAKPWLHEIHVQGDRRPHRVLTHELAHVFAGELASGPFAVRTSFGVLPWMGLVEGVAVAAEEDLGEMAPSTWAAAMKQLGMLPEVADIMGPAGFYGVSSSRAYSAAGAFVGWLIDTEGMSAFARLYGGESFEAVYDRSARDLSAAWSRSLDEVEVDEAALRMAERRFERPSIWKRVCARSAAAERQTGYGRLRRGDLERATPLLEAAQLRQPADVQPLVDLAWEALRRDRFEVARSWIATATTTGAATTLARASGIEVDGALAWAEGDLARARAAFEAVEALEPSTASLRLQSARLLALEREPRLRDVLRAYLNGQLRAEHALAELLTATAEFPEDPLLAYLLGLRLERAGAPEAAIEALQAAEGLPPVLDEARYLALGRSAVRAGDAQRASIWLTRTSTSAERRIHRAQASAWLARSRIPERE